MELKGHSEEGHRTDKWLSFAGQLIKEGPYLKHDCTGDIDLALLAGPVFVSFRYQGRSGPPTVLDF